MRDIAVLAVLVVFTAWTLRRPWIGVMMWTCVSLMSPHVEFGYAAAAWPVATVVAGATLASMLFTREKQNPFIGGAVWAMLAFTAWITITLPFSFYLDECLPLWERSMKIFLMLFVTLALVDNKHKLNVFVWVNVVSIAYYGVKGGVFTVLTAGNYRVWGPGGFIGGNNEVALAVIMVIPLMRYLQLQMTQKWAKLAMSGSMVLCALTALGTYSRGALLGVSAMGFYFWLKSQRKLLWAILIPIIGVAVLSVMPSQWWARMDTIKTYDADDSALGRINAWWMAWNLARDKFFGGGFMIYSLPVFEIYAPEPNRVHAAHSIYFQVLGEHGFVGLFLFLLIGVLTWLTASSLIKRYRDDPQRRWGADLGAMVQVGMIGYAVAGAFLSLSYFDLPYNLMVMCVVARHILRRDEAAAAAAAAQGAPHPGVAAALPATPARSNSIKMRSP